MEEFGANRCFQGISFIFFPLLTNLSLLLFLCFSIDLYEPSSAARNVIGIIGLFVYYIGCLLLFFAYGRSTHGLHDLFGRNSNSVIIIILIVTYPIFFLFWLPYLIYQLLLYSGTPKALWEKVFSDTAFSLENLYPELNKNGCVLFGRYIYIGIPFIIFALIYILIIVFFTPVWYYILSPLGLGTFGICLFVSLRFPHSTESDLNERCQRSYRWGVFIHVYTLALPCVLLSSIYLATAGAHWHAIFMLVCTALHFIVDVVPATMGVCRGGGRASLSNQYL